MKTTAKLHGKISKDGEKTVLEIEKQKEEHKQHLELRRQDQAERAGAFAKIISGLGAAILGVLVLWDSSRRT